VPDWYGLVRAARYLGVTPWALLEQPLAWQAWATIAENAELEADKARAEQQQQQAG
jgi:hypothetical protein